MKYLSVCSGIEAATVAWHPLGWTPAAFSEIEKFPRAVLQHHYPDVPLHGDFTTIKDDEYGPVDLLVGGTPCQDFSVAGLRAGIAGERGNLTLEFLRLASRMAPRWIVWENVPGVLSSDGGRALGAFLGGLANLGYGFAYRVLDAQYFGLAQRRSRVFVVGHLGDWRRAAAVLFERESLCGHPAPRREAREGIAPTISARTKGGGGLGTDFGCDGGLIAPDVSLCLNAGGMGRQDSESETLIAHSLRAEGFDASEDGTGRGTPLVPMTFDWQAGGGGADASFRGKSRSYITDKPGRTRALTANKTLAVAFSAKDHGGDAGDISPTLRAGGHDGSHANGGVMPAVAFDLRGREGGAQFEGPHDTANMRAASGGSSRSYVAHSAVRRLTPRECERLQGFPEIHREVTIRICGSEEEKRALASCAGAHSAARNRAVNEPVAAHVLIDLERSEVQLLKAGRLIWSASGAGKPSASPLSMPIADFVHAAAAMTTIAVPQIQGGVAASPLSISGSLPRWSGSAFVPVSGRAIGELAAAAAKLATEATRSTTLRPGQHSQTDASTLETLSCCVVAAISSCIREQIHLGNSFSVSVETQAGYTLIPYRGKPAADGPRYKALGNSMAVPVMHWIGQRIDMVPA